MCAKKIFVVPECHFGLVFDREWYLCLRLG